MKFLLDTNVISEIIARQPNPRVITWLDSIDENIIYLSAITVGEIGRGIERLPESHRRTNLLNWLQNDLLARFSNRILPLDLAVMLRWGEFVANLEKRGRSLPAMDSLIAATALYYELVLVTRNTKDFALTGLQVLDPWQVG